MKLDPDAIADAIIDAKGLVHPFYAAVDAAIAKHGVPTDADSVFISFRSQLYGAPRIGVTPVYTVAGNNDTAFAGSAVDAADKLAKRQAEERAKMQAEAEKRAKAIRLLEENGLAGVLA